MSTFDGRVSEFPDIRIDYFRVSPKERVRPLAFFLSHVHSDHLQGLENCKSPFIYCSPATREMLLRLEKYPHRMNFAKGILEARKQTYRHLASLLKPIPLETPTVLELTPKRSIRVTLFDANHCTGATVFLIQDDTHAIMYTGDIRSEQWWVDSLTRHPLLVPFACQDGHHPLKRLDCIYLDTTFATKSPPYKHFATKREGIAELLRAVAQYPSNTIFYFDTWTFGYEEVWLALSAFLESKVHVDDYRYGIYHALSRATVPQSNDVHHLIGYFCGNHYQDGCLTRDQARIHSCERGTSCDVLKRDFVRITPIISRHDGIEIAELGIGGGQGDLDLKHELDLGDMSTITGLIKLCREKLNDDALGGLALALLSSPLSSIPLDPQALQSVGDRSAEDMNDVSDLPIEAIVPFIVKYMSERRELKEGIPKVRVEKLRLDGLPDSITFPYSRHASYDELRFLITAFLPEDIYPCTVNLQDWNIHDSMEFLFADLYPAGKTFMHDRVMERLARARKTSSTKGIPVNGASDDHTKAIRPSQQQQCAELPQPLKSPNGKRSSSNSEQREPAQKRERLDHVLSDSNASESSSRIAMTEAIAPPSAQAVKKAMRREAFQAALGQGELCWSDLNLISTKPRHEEGEL